MQSTDSKRHTTWDALQKESIFGQEKTRKQVMEEIMAEPDLYQQFLKLSPRLQEELVEFAMGVRGLNVTFDPDTRKKRLEEFLSLCMKQKVKILRVLPSESQRLTEEGSLLVMDILVQQSTAEFRQYPEDYLHYFEITVQTGGKYHKKVCCKLAFVCISTFL